MKRYPWSVLAVALACAACAGGDEAPRPDAKPTPDGPRADRAADQATPGSAGAPCYGNGTCDPGLTCVGDVCVPEADAGPPDLPSPDVIPPDGPVWPEAQILEARTHDLPPQDSAPPDAPRADGAGKPCTTNPECDDSLPCTIDVCGVDGCTNVPTNGCVIGGKCVASGAANATNACEVCDPARAVTSWSNADEQGCDDQDPCTYGDACVNGQCEGTPFSCDDGLDCTTDSCTGVAPPAGCTNEIAAGYCTILDSCVAEFATDPQAACLICDPLRNPTDWSLMVGSCFIDNTCYANGTVNPLNSCEVCNGASHATTWSPMTPTPSPLQVMVTEFLANPNAVFDTAGEWIELYNASSTGVDLNGWTLKDEGIDSHIIQGPLILGPGEYMVLAANSDPATNGGVTVDYEYKNFALSNLDDEIILIDSSCRPVDAVRYDATWDLAAGSAHGLRDTALDNAFASNWCHDQPKWSGSAGDKGTPGAANLCAALVPDAGLPDTGPPPPDLGIADVNPIDSSRGDAGAVVPCVTTGVVLDEVAVGNTDYVALHNHGTSALSIVGYKVVMYGIAPYAPDIYTIKATDVSGPLAAGARVYIFEYSSGTQPGDINTGANIPFYNGPPSAKLPNAVALYDASGNLIDYWAVGDTIGKPQNVTFTAIAWPTDFSSSTDSFRRAVHKGTCPSFKYTDWGYGDLTR